MKYEEMIRKRVPQKALLLQTVEEIAETVKAGCKMLRALGNGSPTPVKPEMARENLQEEVHDLVNMWHVLDMERAVKAPLTPQNIGGMKSEEKAILGMMHHLTEASAILMDQAAGFQDGYKVATKAATLEEAKAALAQDGHRIKTNKLIILIIVIHGSKQGHADGDLALVLDIFPVGLFCGCYAENGKAQDGCKQQGKKLLHRGDPPQ